VETKFFIFNIYMHNISVLSFGSSNFNISLKELKDYLNCKLNFISTELSSDVFDEYDILLIHEDFFSEKNLILSEKIKKINKVKILVHNPNSKVKNLFIEKIQLPLKLGDLNQCIGRSVVKKSFSINSSIKIKNYTLDKNEKKLLKDKKSILLTEKEIQLLELFVENSSNPISKGVILDEVWKYSPDADTHTVETHIYRLRKKIKTNFLDDYFILNDKDGYFL
tara:strand:+ start:1673 stop:2341 length:669 start_codon:yes stop_codon:yes gene_type:complete